jgi:hypothetical protein
MAQTKVKLKQLEPTTVPGSIIASNTSNDFAIIAPTPGADVIPFYDDSATAVAWLTIGTNLSISGTTLNASAGAGGYAEIQEEGSPLTARTKFNFVGAGITASDDAGNTRTNITLDTTLNSLAAYNTNGFLVQTAADTFTGRSLTAPAAGITISNNDGVAGNPTFALANDLAAVEGLASNGIAVRTATDTWATRTITGTTNKIVVTNGDGISGNPTLDVGSLVAVLSDNETVSGTWTFSNNITLNGTPSAGTDVTNVTFVNTAIANAVAGLRKGSVRGATTAILTATAQTATTITLGGTTFTHDGITYVNGDTILVKDSVTGGSGGAFNNGVYTVGGIGSSVVLTRVSWMDAASEIDGVYVAVEDGTTNVGTLWITVSEVTTLGTDTITFTRIQTTGTIDGTGSANKVAYWSDADTLTFNTNFTYDGNNLIVGTTTAAGSTRLTSRGSGTGSSTYNYTGQNSSGTSVFRVADDGTLTIGATNQLSVTKDGFSATTNSTYAFDYAGASTGFTFTGSGNTGVDVAMGANTSNVPNLSVSGSRNSTSANQIQFRSGGSFTPSAAGTNTFAGVDVNHTINQTGGHTGITYGINVSPTLTAASDYRGFYANVSASHYAIYSDSGKVRLDVGSDANWDLLTRSATGELIRIANGTTGQVLTATTGSAPTWQAAAGGTITRAYLTGSTSSVIDLDSGTAVTDVDGTNIAFTVPADLDKTFVVRNGVVLSRSGTVSRDYTLVSATGVLTLATALTSDESLMVYKIA